MNTMRSARKNAIKTEIKRRESAGIFYVKFDMYEGALRRPWDFSNVARVEPSGPAFGKPKGELREIRVSLRGDEGCPGFHLVRSGLRADPEQSQTTTRRHWHPRRSGRRGCQRLALLDREGVDQLGAGRRVARPDWASPSCRACRPIVIPISSVFFRPRRCSSRNCISSRTATLPGRHACAPSWISSTRPSRITPDDACRGRSRLPAGTFADHRNSRQA